MRVGSTMVDGKCMLMVKEKNKVKDFSLFPASIVIRGCLKMAKGQVMVRWLVKMGLCILGIGMKVSRREREN